MNNTIIYPEKDEWYAANDSACMCVEGKDYPSTWSSNIHDRELQTVTVLTDSQPSGKLESHYLDLTPYLEIWNYSEMPLKVWQSTTKNNYGHTSFQFNAKIVPELIFDHSINNPLRNSWPNCLSILS